MEPLTHLEEPRPRPVAHPPDRRQCLLVQVFDLKEHVALGRKESGDSVMVSREEFSALVPRLSLSVCPATLHVIQRTDPIRSSGKQGLDCVKIIRRCALF